MSKAPGAPMPAEKKDREDTAGKLLVAGMQLFGELGFKATTTRMIAQRANSNIGSIAYYFGNKRNLYRAILAHIAERMQTKFQLSDMEQRTPAFVSPDEARARLRETVRRMVRTFASEGEAGQWLLLVMREQADPSDGYDLLYEGVFDRVYTALGVPIAYLMGKSLDDVEVVIECHTLIGQIVFFLVGKHPFLRRLGRAEGFDESMLERIEKVVFSHLERYRPST